MFGRLFGRQVQLQLQVRRVQARRGEYNDPVITYFLCSGRLHGKYSFGDH